MNTETELLGFVGGMGMLGLILLGLVLIWIVVIKGVALWHAARNGHVAWFIALLLLNTLGILELIYLFVVAKKREPVA